MNIELYIENEKVDLTDKISFPLNKKWDNLNNPTDIINDFSKTISIPRTKHNDNLFGNIFKLDKYTVINNTLGVPSHIESGTYSNYSWTVNNTSVNKLQLGVIDTVNYDTWKYTLTKSFTSNFGTEYFEFTYDSNTMHRLEFSLRDIYDNEYSWLQFNIESGLTTGQTYVCSFTYNFSGGVCRITNTTLSVKNSNKYIFFNPAKKASFKLIYNGDMLMEGYCKMNSIGNSVDSKSYEINLFGKMGEVFQDMKNITFNKDNAIDTKYVVEEPIEAISLCQERVKDSFENYQACLSTASSDWKDWYGFIPTNRGLYDNFDSKIYIRNGVKQSFVDTIANSNTSFNETDAETIVGDGIEERTIGELRSYYQKPYVYVNKLIQLLRDKFLEIHPDYKFYLDSSFFNDKNPYWRDLIYMCNYLDTEDSALYTNYYMSQPTNVTNTKGSTLYEYRSGLPGMFYNWYCIKTGVLYNDTLYLNNVSSTITTDLTEYITTENVKLLDSDNIHFMVDENNTYRVKLQTNLALWMQVQDTGSKMSLPTHLFKTTIKKENYLNIELRAVDDSGNTISSRAYKIGSDDCIYDVDFKINGYVKDKYMMSYWSESLPGQDTYITYAVHSLSDLVLDAVVQNATRFKFQLRLWWADSNVDNLKKRYASTNTYANTPCFVRLKDYKDVSYSFTEVNPSKVYCSFEAVESKRSFQNITLKKLIGEDFNLFDFMVRYCKMFGLVIDYNYIKKEIRILSRNTYFSHYTIEDWNDKVDRSKDFHISPVSFDKKYELFSYEDTDGAYYKDFKDKYGYPYGALKLDTGYAFNTDSNNLFKDGYVSTILSNDNIYNWNDIYDDGELFKRKNSECLPTFYQIDGSSKKSLDCDGCFAFRKQSQKNWDTGLRYPRITDDTYQMLIENSYCYNQEDSSGVKSQTRPDIDIEDGGWGCLWTKAPEVYYDYVSNDSVYIYDAAWHAYIEDRYNVNNRKLTAYFNLSPLDYTNFKFNKFIKLDNCLYVVNQIYDYDVNSNVPTKVELIQVSDISKYTQGQLYPTYHALFADTKSIIIPTSKTETFNLTLTYNNYPISITCPDWLTVTMPMEIDEDGTYKVIVTATTYKGKKSRSGYITLTGAMGDVVKIKVIQPYCQIAVSKYSCILKSAANSSDSVTYVNSLKAKVSISGTPTWLNVTQTKVNNNSYKITFTTRTSNIRRTRAANIVLSNTCGVSVTIKVVQQAKKIIDSLDTVKVNLTANTQSINIATPASVKFKKEDGTLVDTIELTTGLTASTSALSNGEQTITITKDSTYTGGTATYTSVIVRDSTIEERNLMNQSLVMSTNGTKVMNRINKTTLQFSNALTITIP